MGMEDPHHLLKVATQSALQAGKVLRDGFGMSHTITAKVGRQNIVTEYDKLSEETIIACIKEHFPTHTILAEESGLSQSSSESIIWIIDPLDGTSNFARHLPLFAISIAAYQGEKGLCGVIFQPMTNELFTAERGKGAFLNGAPLQVSTITNIEEAMFGSGFPYDMQINSKHHTKDLLRLVLLGASVRNLGSAALALAYVAAGKLEGYWMDYLYPWDFAAGQILIEEAGGKMIRYGSSSDISLGCGILATNAAIHQRMRNYLDI